MTKLDPFVLTIDHETWLDFFDAAVANREEVPDHVVVAGMPGSGTTLLAQVVRSLGVTLTKLHKYSDASIPKLVIYRDPRDLVCGAALRQLKAVTETEGIAAGQIAAYKYLFEGYGYHKAFEQYAADPRSHLFNYEHYLPSRVQSLVNAVGGVLGLELRKWFTEYLAWEFSVQRNKERAALLTNGFSDIDQVSGIHGDHITMDGTGGILCPEASALINENLSEFMTKWGYV